MGQLPSRAQFLHWLAWFFGFNAFLCFLIQATYLHFLDDLHLIPGGTEGGIILAWSFLFASYIAHAAILTAFAAIPAVLLVYFYPKRWLILPLSAVLSTGLVVTHLADRIAFSLFHMHNLTEAWEIATSGTLSFVLPLTLTELALFIFVFVVVLLCELGLGLYTWTLLQKHAWRRATKSLLGLVTVSVCLSYLTMAATVGPLPERLRLPSAYRQMVLRMARLVPYYTNLYQVFFLDDDGSKVAVVSHKKSVPVITQGWREPLHYPLAPMQCQRPKKPMNVLVIMLDTWRYAQMNKTVTPNIARFAESSWQFKNHFSGGNCTQAGVFSLFYGLPAMYWDAFRDQQKRPEMLKQFEQAGYHFQIEASAPLTFPQFDKTIFKGIKPLRLFTYADSTPARDAIITKNMVSYLQSRDKKQPFFGFVFYDGMHNYCEGSEWQYQKPFQPAVHDCARFSLTNETNPLPYLNRYRNAAYSIDKKVGRLLATLRTQGDLDNTIVIITGDHGTEFNDTKHSYWSHASAYNRSQIQVPMIIHWPGKTAKQFAYRTTHMDLAPTLMKTVLGCQANPSAYSVGHSLMRKGQRDLLICTSYNDYAVISDKRLARIFPHGDYLVKTHSSESIAKAELNPRVMKRVYERLTRFYGKPGKT